MAPNHLASDEQLASHAHPDTQDDQHQRLSPVPLAGPGTTRANRRLQLRKNGFRGKTVHEHQQHQQQQQQQTPRSRTPDKQSGGWSPGIVNDLAALLDGAGDSKMHDRYDSDSRRQSSNILQEVNNSSLRRKERGKARMDPPLVSIFHDENAEAEGDSYESGRDPAWQLESSPACLAPDAPDLTRSKRKQRSTSDMVRDAMLDEKDQYIEHLESQLAATQTQLSSITSPTVTQARSLKMRALNGQIRVLREELAEWEARFHNRLREENEERTHIEATLKSRVRVLEEDVEAYALNAKELQQQLEQTRNSLEAAESSNVELEKRLDTFASIVATSPQKTEFGGTSWVERRGHVRRQSAMPRFPTTGSLQPHPSTWTMPRPLSSSSSANNFQIQEEGDATVPSEVQSEVQPSPQTISPSHSSVTNEMDFAYMESASKRDSMISTTSSRLSWTFPDGASIDGVMCSSTGKARPSRRMRRFHAGSIMPKPLILSGTTHMNAMNAPPMTAPPMDSHNTPPSFPFPEIEAGPPRRLSFDDSPLLAGRRRAHTDADGLSPEHLYNLSLLPGFKSPNSVSSACSREGTHEVEASDLVSPDVANTLEKTPRDFSSLGSTTARNLFEELSRARTSDSANIGSIPGSSPPSVAQVYDAGLPLLSRCPSNQSPSQLRQRRILHHRSISEQTALPLRSRSRTVMGLPSLTSAPHSAYTQSHSSRHAQNHGRSRASTSSQHLRTESKGAQGSSIVTIVSDFCRHPYLLARRVIMRGEKVMLVKQGVGKLQWWLLTFLLGPVICTRLIGAAQPLGLGSLSAESWRKECRRQTRKSGQGSCTCGAGRREAEDEESVLNRHSPWLWIKFSLTLAFAIGAAIKDGPGSLLRSERKVGRYEQRACTCPFTSDMVDMSKLSLDIGTEDVEMDVVGISREAVDGTDDGSHEQVAIVRPGIERSTSQRSLADELEDADFDEDEDEHEHEQDERGQ